MQQRSSSALTDTACLENLRLLPIRVHRCVYLRVHAAHPRAARMHNKSAPSHLPRNKSAASASLLRTHTLRRQHVLRTSPGDANALTTTSCLTIRKIHLRVSCFSTLEVTPATLRRKRTDIRFICKDDPVRIAATARRAIVYSTHIRFITI